MTTKSTCRTSVSTWRLARIPGGHAALQQIAAHAGEERVLAASAPRPSETALCDNLDEQQQPRLAVLSIAKPAAYAARLNPRRTGPMDEEGQRRSTVLVFDESGADTSVLRNHKGRTDAGADYVPVRGC
jgi:hypothetical protein